MAQVYVCGFLFSPDRTRVLLIRKNRPEWQRDRLNGVGGKVEAGETLPQAMRREFREEAGMDVPEADWRHVVTLSGRDDGGSGADWEGHFFRAFGDVERAVAMTDEKLEIHLVQALPRDTIPNLHWMIPLMLDDDVVAGAYHVEVNWPA
jgi:8-oxo-dGTP diphosphatase